MSAEDHKTIGNLVHRIYPTLKSYAESWVGMAFAASVHLSLVAGAIGQEIIDVLAVLNALRAAFPPRVISDLGA